MPVFQQTLNLVLLTVALPCMGVITHGSRLINRSTGQMVTLLGDFHDPAPLKETSIVLGLDIETTAAASKKNILTFIQTHANTELWLEACDKDLFKIDCPARTRSVAWSLIDRNDLQALPTTQVKAIDPRGYTALLEYVATELSNIQQTHLPAIALRYINQELTNTQDLLDIPLSHALEELEHQYQALTQAHARLAAHARATNTPSSTLFDGLVRCPASSEIIATTELLQTKTLHLINRVKQLPARNFDLARSPLEQVKEAYKRQLRLQVVACKSAANQAAADEHKACLDSIISELITIGVEANQIVCSQIMDTLTADAIVQKERVHLVLYTGFAHAKNMQDILLACGYELETPTAQILSSYCPQDELTSMQAFQLNKVPMCPIPVEELDGWLNQQTSLSIPYQWASLLLERLKNQ